MINAFDQYAADGFKFRRLFRAGSKILWSSSFLNCADAASLGREAPDRLFEKTSGSNIGWNRRSESAAADSKGASEPIRLVCSRH